MLKLTIYVANQLLIQSFIYRNKYSRQTKYLKRGLKVVCHKITRRIRGIATNSWLGEIRDMACCIYLSDFGIWNTKFGAPNIKIGVPNTKIQFSISLTIVGVLNTKIGA